MSLSLGAARAGKFADWRLGFAAGAGELETRAHAPLLGLQGRCPGPIVPARTAREGRLL